MRDLRDPKVLGTLLLFERSCYLADIPLSKVHDLSRHLVGGVVDYSSNPSCIEKYGYPQKLPSTLPN